MIIFDKAYQIVMDTAIVKSPVQKKMKKFLGRVLREDVVSDMDMPPFDKAAVDGYACRMQDLDKELEVIEIVPAGVMPSKEVGEGQCVKIMTGAPIPKGADVAIMVEHTEQVGENSIRYLREKTKSNIAYKAEDIKKGEVVLPNGILIKPQHIAVLATVGAIKLKVSKKVKVGIISTGDELVEPTQKPMASQIRNSNASQLIDQVNMMGAKPIYIGIAKDTEKSTRKRLQKAFKECDVILLSGGVSMGEFDFVPQILKELEVNILFESIAVQPGRPTVYGVRDNQYVFGLPGNPVSSFVQFELLVKPLIYKLMGHEYQHPSILLPIGKEIYRKNQKRMSWKPIRIIDGKIYPMEYHGSAHINALTAADGMVAVPIGQTSLVEGELVLVRLI